jgi:hypothetical protein
LSVARNTGTAWRKSQWSGTGNCVEARTGRDFVEVRDSKHPQGPILRFTFSEWDAFLEGVSSGEFDLPLDSKRA